MKTTKFLWAAAGFLLTGIGAAGAMIPLVPCVVFLLGAAFCFAKSSRKLENWFRGTKLYKNNLETYAKGEGMTRKTKVGIMASVTITMGIGFAMMGAVPMGRAVLVIVWIFHVIYFGFRVKTVEASV